MSDVKIAKVKHDIKERQTGMCKRKNRFLIYILLAMLLLCGCAAKKKNVPEETVNAEQTNEQAAEEDTTLTAEDVQMTAVVEEWDTDKLTITLFDIKEKRSHVLNYSGGTDIRDAYDQLITVPQLAYGEIVDAVYDVKSDKLKVMTISKAAWSYRNVGNLVTDKTAYRMYIGKHTYWYDEGLEIFSNNKMIDLIDLHHQDVLTVRGIDSQICSIEVTKGHGYIRLKEYRDFIGGTIEVGKSSLPVVSDMVLVAREGAQTVYLQCGELTAEEEVTLRRNEEIVLDLSAYKMPAERIGYVRFDIEPFGAELYINGKETDYIEPVKMNYGKHRIQVTMNGYNEFKGVLTIGESTPTISIRLAESESDEAGEGTVSSKDSNDTTIEEEVYEEPEEEDNEEEAEEEDDSEDYELATGTTSVDQNHTITIEAPTGATVYFNGEKKGTIPLTFTKEIGNHILVMTKEGYSTKSYSIQVLDDGENAVFRFPDMAAK